MPHKAQKMCKCKNLELPIVLLEAESPKEQMGKEGVWIQIWGVNEVILSNCLKIFPYLNIYCALLLGIKHCTTEKSKHRLPI